MGIGRWEDERGEEVGWKGGVMGIDAHGQGEIRSVR